MTELAQSTPGSEHAGTASGAGHNAASIPLDQIGAVAQKQYSGDGLSVKATEGGARWRCVFQRMNASATAEGLWITSTVGGAKGEPFQVKAVGVRRTANDVAADVSPLHSPEPEIRADWGLPRTGTVEVAHKVGRFVRPGLTEEYSVSMDGQRQ